MFLFVNLQICVQACWRDSIQLSLCSCVHVCVMSFSTSSFLQCPLGGVLFLAQMAALVRLCLLRQSHTMLSTSPRHLTCTSRCLLQIGRSCPTGHSSQPLLKEMRGIYEGLVLTMPAFRKMELDMSASIIHLKLTWAQIFTACDHISFTVVWPACFTVRVLCVVEVFFHFLLPGHGIHTIAWHCIERKMVCFFLVAETMHRCQKERLMVCLQILYKHCHQGFIQVWGLSGGGGSWQVIWGGLFKKTFFLRESSFFRLGAGENPPLMVCILQDTLFWKWEADFKYVASPCLLTLSA